jgi:riboflavin transporter FmnP
LTEIRTYLFVTLFVTGNLLLPQLCHLIPGGGKMWLPVYFFTLIASYKFGLRAGLLTAVCSPLLNYLLFGMPSAAVLPVLLVKSSLLAVIAAQVSARMKRLSIGLIAVVVCGYQVTGGVAEWAMTGSWQAALQDFTLGVPGILFQIVAGWLALRWIANYEG